MYQIIIFVIRSLLKDLFNPLLVDFSTVKPQIYIPSFYLYAIVFVFAFLASQWLIPQSIRFAHRFRLVDHPTLRKTHLKPIPILGGVSIFISVVLTTSYIAQNKLFKIYNTNVNQSLFT